MPTLLGVASLLFFLLPTLMREVGRRLWKNGFGVLLNIASLVSHLKFVRVLTAESFLSEPQRLCQQKLLQNAQTDTLCFPHADKKSCIQALLTAWRGIPHSFFSPDHFSWKHRSEVLLWVKWAFSCLQSNLLFSWNFNGCFLAPNSCNGYCEGIRLPGCYKLDRDRSLTDCYHIVIKHCHVRTVQHVL